MQMCEKVGKSRNTVFFQCIVALEGRKVGSLKGRVRRTSGEMRNEKLHAVVALSRFWSEKVQNTWVSERFWKLRCQKSARRCGAKHISKSKCTKHTILGPLLEVAMSKKCTPLWREAHFEVNMYKNTTCSRHFWRFRCRFAWQAQKIVHLVKSEQNVRILQHFQKRWQAWGIRRGSSKMHVAWQVQYKRHVHQRCSGSGRSFPEKGCILESQIFRFAEMILRDRCSTSYDLALIFRGRRSTLHRWSGKIAKRIGTRLSALHSTFHFWRKSRRILSF